MDFEEDHLHEQASCSSGYRLEQPLRLQDDRLEALIELWKSSP